MAKKARRRALPVLEKSMAGLWPFFSSYTAEGSQPTRWACVCLPAPDCLEDRDNVLTDNLHHMIVWSRQCHLIGVRANHRHGRRKALVERASVEYMHNMVHHVSSNHRNQKSFYSNQKPPSFSPFKLAWEGVIDFYEKEWQRLQGDRKDTPHLMNPS